MLSKINRLGFILSFLKNGAEPELDGSSDPSSHGLAKSSGGEFQSGSLPLEPPRVTIGVEDALTKQIMEHRLPRGTFRVIVETGLEDVLQIPGIARDCHETLLPGQEGDGTNAGLVRAAARAEVVGDPVMHAITVLDQAW
ncbi:hypothetical protein SCA6_015141 [Theobroma cacao]